METTTTKRTARKPRAPRTVHVLCAQPSGWRWLKAHLNGCAIETPNGFQILNESMWTERLQAAEGKEVK